MSLPLSSPPPPSHPPRALSARSKGARLLVVGGGAFQLDIIRAARHMGAEIVVVDRDPDAPGMALADHPTPVDTADVDGVVDVAERLAVNGVVTAASDAAIGAVAAVGQARGLPAVRPDTARRCRDKLAAFQCLDEAGLPSPPTVAIDSGDAARRRVSDVGGYPTVIKPRAAAGGRGVSIVDGPERMDDAFARASAYAGPDGTALLQRFVGGTSVGVEAFFRGGVLVDAFVLDDQFETGFASPVGHSIPSRLTDARRGSLIRDIERFASALGLQDGPANFDVRLEAGQTILLEVNARLGGNSITDLIRLAHGVDLSAATVRAALGEDPTPDLERRRATPAAGRLVLTTGRGYARLYDPQAEAGELPGVVTVELTAREGMPVTAIVDDWTIVGRVLVRADTHDDAIARAHEAARRVGNALELRDTPEEARTP